MDLGFANKTVLVTGASGGIGQSLARRFVQEGAQVVLHYRTNESSASQLEQELGAERTVRVQADLGDPDQVNRAFDQAIARFGKLDMLVANAGVWPPVSVPLHEMSLQQWQATMDNNLKSVFLCCRRFINEVRNAAIEDPSVVLIGSTAGLFGEAGHADYAASKSALIHGLTLTLKNELVQVARRGRVNTVSPGWVLTPMAQKFADDPAAIRRALATIAMKKVAAPDDIANAVLFLSSSRVAGHITGQNLTVSGGMEGRLLHSAEDPESAEPGPDNPS